VNPGARRLLTIDIYAVANDKHRGVSLRPGPTDRARGEEVTSIIEADASRLCCCTHVPRRMADMRKQC